MTFSMCRTLNRSSVSRSLAFLTGVQRRSLAKAKRRTSHLYISEAGHHISTGFIQPSSNLRLGGISCLQKSHASLPPKKTLPERLLHVIFVDVRDELLAQSPDGRGGGGIGKP